MSSLSILLGTCADAPENPETVLAKTKGELSEARSNAAPSSLDSLEFTVQAEELSTLYDPMELSNWATALRPGATVSVCVKGGEEGADLQPIHTSFLLAGLVGTSERREADGSRILTSTKKETVSNGVPVTLKKVEADGSRVLTSTEKETVSNGVPVTLKKVTLDDTDLIDEDGLLEEESNGLLAPPPAISEASKASKDDCGGRKACDNCSCGRAELEAGEQPKKEIKTSSCGNCAKGDAFRCASCPYLGLPAFKAGEEHLVLELKDDF